MLAEKVAEEIETAVLHKNRDKKTGTTSSYRPPP